MRSRIVSLLFLILCCFGMLSCVHETVRKKPNVTQDENVVYNELNSNALLTGRWVVEGLDVPDCKLCKQNNMRLNKMWNHDLEVGDSFFFTQDSMFYKSSNGQTLTEKFRFQDSTLLLEGFDWSYTMEVKKCTPDNLTLAIIQSFISEINSDEEPKYLGVKLVRSK